MSVSFQKMATVTASTKRSPVAADGKRDVPAGYLTGLKVTPLDPVDPDIIIGLELNTPMELLQTMVEDGPDIKENDVLVVGSSEYRIRAVGDWNWRPSATDTLRLVLEELKI